MTYDARETSTDTGRPVEVYTFARDYQRWRYTSADRDVTVDSQTFVARPISRTQIETTSEKSRLGLSLTVPRDLEVADMYRVAPPTLAITCLIQQYHQGDAELATIWSGRILTVEWSGPSARIALEPIYTALRRNGLRRMYQRQCPHVLYGGQCKVNRESFRTDGVVDSVSGNVITVPQADVLASGYFSGGYIEWDVEIGIVERRFISDHTDAALTVSAAVGELAGGTDVRIYPGCDHTLTTCNSKFGNAVNYGGMPYIPTKNPFGGSPIF